MVAPFGPLATIGYEPRQARKGATVVIDSCAGVWLIGVISSPILTPFRDYRYCVAAVIVINSYRLP